MECGSGDGDGRDAIQGLAQWFSTPMGELEEQLMRSSQALISAQGKGKEKPGGTTENELKDQEQEEEEEEEEEVEVEVEDEEEEEEDNKGDNDGDNADNEDEDSKGDEQEQERRDLEWRLKRVHETMGRTSPTPDSVLVTRRQVVHEMNKLQRQRKRNQQCLDKQRRQLAKRVNERSCLLSEIDIRNCLLRHLDEQIAEMVAEQRSTEQEMAALVKRMRAEQQVATFLKNHHGGRHWWWVRWVMGRKTDPSAHPFDGSYGLRPLVAPVLASVLSRLFEPRSLVPPPIMARLCRLVVIVVVAVVVFLSRGLHRLPVRLLLPATILFLFVSHVCTTLEWD